MNVSLLRKVKRTILAQPEHFRMDKWTCGTAHCIAGTVCALDKSLAFVVPKKKDDIWLVIDGNDEESEVLSVPAAAAQALDLDDEYEGSDADRLFYLEDWPKAFRTDYKKASSAKARAAVAAKRIEHFIKTNGDE